VLQQCIEQLDFAQAVGLSEARVSQLVTEGVLRKGATAGEWLASYCERLRQQAAGRDPTSELSAERARLAREQADKVAMQNAATRRELLPVGVLEAVLTDVARQLAARLESVVPKLRRAHPDLSAQVLAQVAAELDECRTACASINLADGERILDGEDDDEDGDAAP
jgi:phage terminase Nu1 subunit (DNA packaging protein)